MYRPKTGLTSQPMVTRNVTGQRKLASTRVSLNSRLLRPPILRSCLPIVNFMAGGGPVRSAQPSSEGLDAILWNISAHVARISFERVMERKQSGFVGVCSQVIAEKVCSRESLRDRGEFVENLRAGRQCAGHGIPMILIIPINLNGGAPSFNNGIGQQSVTTPIVQHCRIASIGAEDDSVGWRKNLRQRSQEDCGTADRVKNVDQLGFEN